MRRNRELLRTIVQYQWGFTKTHTNLQTILTNLFSFQHPRNEREDFQMFRMPRCLCRRLLGIAPNARSSLRRITIGSDGDHVTSRSSAIGGVADQRCTSSPPLGSAADPSIGGASDTSIGKDEERTLFTSEAPAGGNDEQRERKAVYTSHPLNITIYRTIDMMRDLPGYTFTRLPAHRYLLGFVKTVV
jgi:hypothetical protein